VDTFLVSDMDKAGQKLAGVVVVVVVVRRLGLLF
jgi:hypothetical protein